MVERLLQLIIRLKDIFIRIEESHADGAGNEAELLELKSKVASLEADQSEALAMLDDLEEVIKRWE